MTSTSTLAGKRALVTGVSRGIGAAIARRLASQGATVAVNYRSDRAADTAQTHELVGAVVSEFGGLDLLVSNAGVEHFGALETITQAELSRCSEDWQKSPVYLDKTSACREPLLMLAARRSLAVTRTRFSRPRTD
jgi:NAD(P)-dependent dehydrogenase (short-subunit alcohol dehydrogenase family)